jgi:riboflavin kinase/FMN adenylyltransferase
MIVVRGVRELRPEHGRLFIVLGVFDGLHRGHAYLLEALRAEAEARRARPTVITFDHHPDEILTGSAPPLLLDPEERLERLREAGVEVTVVQHFDVETRETPYDVFIGEIAARVDLAGFLMTSESSFGYERGGTPATVAALGNQLGYDVVVAPTLELDGQPVRSAEIRAAIASGDLAGAAMLLGRPYAIAGAVDAAGQLRVTMPVALPPPGHHPVSVDGRDLDLEIDANGAMHLARDAAMDPTVRVVFR